MTAGVGIGFDYHLANNIVIGGALEASWLGARQSQSIGPVSVAGDLDYVGVIRANLGYSFGTWMPYATVGYGWGHLRGDVSGLNLSADDFASGIVYGAGVKFALSSNWSAKLEWLRYDFDGSLDFGLAAASAAASVDTVKLGLQYRFGG